MSIQERGENLFDGASVWRILVQIAPPVMLAQLIQALYNIVDSFFVGRFSGDGLTALSIIYPVQTVLTAIAVGTGVGVNTKMSRHYARKEDAQANAAAGTGTALALLSWLAFSAVSTLLMRPYVRTSATSENAVEYAVTYGTIVCIGSLGVFLEGCWSKVHQAGGNMRRPMTAQIAGAAVNMALDPLLIFGWGPLESMGVSGAALATVAGQTAAAVITASGFRRAPGRKELLACAKEIYRLGFPSIFMQSLYTVYIMALNVILAGFSDAAVVVLGLYYKLQTFFFIPLAGLQTCMVPLLSYTCAKGDYRRCHRIMRDCTLISMAFMLAGTACFECVPRQLIGIFSSDPEALAIGERAFRVIGLSFVPVVVSLMTPVFFQAIGGGLSSVLLSLTRQIFCLIPLFWLLAKLGLEYTWLAFPASELITSGIGAALYVHQLRKWQISSVHSKRKTGGSRAMKLITAIVNRKDAGEVCRSLTEAGYYFTKLASTGGFLTAGNTTLMIGTGEEKVEGAISLIRRHCSRRVEPVAGIPQASGHPAAYPTEVTVGGAVIFVTAVEQFEKV